MDFLDEVLNDNGPVEKQITYNGKSGPAYFKRITGAQKLQLVKGRKYTYNTAGPDAPQSIDIDLEDNEKSQHLMVHFSCCDAAGRPKFKTVGDVQKLDAQLIAALYEAASEVNKAADNVDNAPGES